jgi:hypothetical protein
MLCFNRYWISHFPVHFDLDCHLKTVVKRLGELVLSEGNTSFKELIDLSQV